VRPATGSRSLSRFLGQVPPYSVEQPVGPISSFAPTSTRLGKFPRWHPLCRGRFHFFPICFSSILSNDGWFPFSRTIASPPLATPFLDGLVFVPLPCPPRPPPLISSYPPPAYLFASLTVLCNFGSYYPPVEVITPVPIHS